MSFSTESKTEFERLRDEIRRGKRIVSIGGLTSVSAKAYVLSRLQAETNKNFVIIADSNKELETWNCDLDFWQSSVQSENENSQLATRKSQLLSLPSFETDVYSGISPHAETQEERALALWRLTRETPAFVLTS